MNFNGDPLKANFDITAGYTAKTTTYELIRNETTLSKQEVAAAQKDRQQLARIVTDYIAGMTDRFALQEHARLLGHI